MWIFYNLLILSWYIKLNAWLLSYEESIIALDEVHQNFCTWILESTFLKKSITNINIHSSIFCFHFERKKDFLDGSFAMQMCKI